MSDERPEEQSVPSDGAPDVDSAARRLVCEAEPFLDLNREEGSPKKPQQPAPQPFQFEEFSHRARRISVDGSFAGTSPIHLDVELGRTQLDQDELAALSTGSLVTLNALASEPLDILADGRLIARGEAVTIGDQPGIRIVEIL